MYFVPLWDSILDNLKMHRLGPETIGRWTWLLACAQRHDRHNGTLPDIETLAFWLRHSEDEIREWLKELMAAKLIDREDRSYVIHDWNQWRCSKDRTAKDRMKRMRERKKNESQNGDVTPVTRNKNRNADRNVTVPVTPPVTSGYEDVTRLDKKRREHSSLRSECVAGAHETVTPDDTHTREDLLTGRNPSEHQLFLEVVEMLERHQPTKHLSSQLVMAADTPEIRGFPSWRLWVGAILIQRPNRSKDWPLFLSFCRNTNEDEHRRLKTESAAKNSESKPKIFPIMREGT